jgi:hypothetical protein
MADEALLGWPVERSKWLEGVNSLFKNSTDFTKQQLLV